MLTLLGGSAGGQALALGLAPLLTRLYDPRAFGILGLFVAVTTIAASVASLGLEQAVVLETDPRESRRAFGLSLLLASAIATAATIAGLAVCGTGLVRDSSLPAALLLLPAVLLAATSQILAAHALAIEAPRAVAALRFLRAAGVGGAQLALALVLPRTGLALVAGAILGQALAIAAVLPLLAHRPGPILGDLDAIRRLLARHRTLLAWSTPQTLLNSAGNALIPISIGRLSGAAAVGDVSLASRVTLLPAITLGEAMRQSMLATMSRLPDASALGALARRATLLLALLLVPSAIAFAFAAPDLFEFVFGSRWRSAGIEAGWLLAAQAAGIVNIPALTVITVRRWQHPHLVFQACTIPLRIAGLVIAGLEAGPQAAIAAYAVLSIAASLALTTVVLVRLAPPAPVARAGGLERQPA